MAKPETYHDVINRLYVRDPQGETEGEIQRGEERLGRSFPRVLRDYYLFTAHGELFNCTQDRLLARQPCSARRVPSSSMKRTSG